MHENSFWINVAQKFKTSLMRISLLTLLINFSIVFSLEFMQYMKGKQFNSFILDNIFFIQLFLIASRHHMATIIILFLAIIYQLLETGSWIYVNSSLNFQVLSSIDIRWMWSDHREMLIAIPTFLIIFLVIYRANSFFKSYFLIEVNSNKIIFTATFVLVLLYKFAHNVYKALYPFSNMSSPISGERNRIFRYFRSEPKLLNWPNNSTKKNLIFFEIESFEQQSLGKYNNYHPNLMSFLTKYSEKGTFMSNMIPQPYTTWTTASIFATHCGMPHVVTDMTYGVLLRASQTSDWPNVSCFPDFLHMAGYNQFAVATGDTKLMKMKDFFEKHHIQMHDFKIHGKRHDWGTINYTISEMFPILEKSQPFYLFVTNDNTHPFFYIEDRCVKRINASKMLNSFDCFDQIFEKFVYAYENSTFFQNTLFVVLGDHLMIGDFNGVYDPPRKLAMFMPYEEKRDITKQTTLYDVAPTILDMLGIKYWPTFPFGANLFSEDIGIIPSKHDLSTIYDILHSTIDKKSDRIKCFGKVGFCDDSNSYFKDRKVILKMNK